MLQWVVGTLGVLEATGIRQAIMCMDALASECRGLLRISAMALVQALVYVRRNRKGEALREGIWR